MDGDQAGPLDLAGDRLTTATAGDHLIMVTDGEDPTTAMVVTGDTTLTTIHGDTPIMDTIITTTITTVIMAADARRILLYVPLVVIDSIQEQRLLAVGMQALVVADVDPQA